MRLVGRISMVVIVAGLVCGLAQGKYGGGTGEPNDPYQIWDANDMQAIGADANDWDKCFKLMADIDLGQFDGKDGRPAFNTIGYEDHDDTHSWYVPFTGVFNGNGHRIYNLGVDGYSPAGLVNVLSGGTISDLELIDPDVIGMYHVGSLVGLLRSGTITNCHVEGGRVSGCWDVGGLIGRNGDCGYYFDVCLYIGAGRISDCYVVDTTVVQSANCGDYVDYRSVGGLVGMNWGTLTECYSAASVTGCGNGVGGLVGLNTRGCRWMGDTSDEDCTDGLIAYCYSASSVDGNDYVGGLVGRNEGVVANCCAIGDVAGGSGVGGLVGFNQADVMNCYAIGRVEGIDCVGGLVGLNHDDVANCYATGSVDGSDHVGGLVGRDDGSVIASFWDIQTSGQTASPAGTGKTTAEMRDPNTFRLWVTCGNEGVWTIDEDNDYPRLAWQGIPGIPIPAFEQIYGGGSGTEDDPYQICTAEHLNTIGQIPCHWNKQFKLMADIDLSEFDGEEGREKFSAIDYSFTGVFDGKGHVIHNLTRNHCQGLFGSVWGGEIKNLGLVDPNIKSTDHAGALVGRLGTGAVRNCHVEGGTVSGEYMVGGLVGTSGGCGSSWYSWCTGYGTVSECYVLGTSVTGRNRAGGLIGSNWGSITNSYATGYVIGESTVGGLVGVNGMPADLYNTPLPEISNCYSTMHVFGGVEAGGLVGANLCTEREGECATVANSYWDTQTSDAPNMCGSQEEGATGCDPNYGKTTAEMMQQSTFQGWDFINVWAIGENQTYPYLRTVPAGDINKDRIVNLFDFAIIADQWMNEQ